MITFSYVFVCVQEVDHPTVDTELISTCTDSKVPTKNGAESQVLPFGNPTPSETILPNRLSIDNKIMCSEYGADHEKDNVEAKQEGGNIQQSHQQVLSYVHGIFVCLMWVDLTIQF